MDFKWFRCASILWARARASQERLPVRWTVRAVGAISAVAAALATVGASDQDGSDPLVPARNTIGEDSNPDIRRNSLMTSSSSFEGLFGRYTRL